MHALCAGACPTVPACTPRRVAAALPGRLTCTRAGTHRASGEQVAVKVLDVAPRGRAAGENANTWSDVAAEIAVLARLDHRAIIALHEFYVQGARVYLVTTLVQGEMRRATPAWDPRHGVCTRTGRVDADRMGSSDARWLPSRLAFLAAAPAPRRFRPQVVTLTAASMSTFDAHAQNPHRSSPTLPCLS